MLADTYVLSNWSPSADAIRDVLDEMNEIRHPEKVDANSLFRQESAAFKSLATEQKKVVDVFKKRLLENLLDKNKTMLTEDDVIAMQAYITACNSLAGLTKEQVGIKKNIAELKIKQYMNGIKASSSTNGSSTSAGSLSTNDIGLNILNNIMNMPSTSTSIDYNDDSYTTSKTPDEMIAEAVDEGEISDYILNEQAGITTYVVTTKTGSNPYYAYFDKNGNELPNRPNIASQIEKIDLGTNDAENSIGEHYQIKIKD